jgi:hypothetical protein
VTVTPLLAATATPLLAAPATIRRAENVTPRPVVMMMAIVGGTGVTRGLKGGNGELLCVLYTEAHAAEEEGQGGQEGGRSFIWHEAELDIVGKGKVECSP